LVSFENIGFVIPPIYAVKKL